MSFTEAFGIVSLTDKVVSFLLLQSVKIILTKKTRMLTEVKIFFIEDSILNRFN